MDYLIYTVKSWIGDLRDAWRGVAWDDDTVEGDE